ncbi:MAG: hypothetical protein TRG1_1188 [Flavobacteriaceae bacterium FS1-H7996/R]|nr:MAG: hypothetical protein TRG1_1188 [Flavobacteriaceae bacterium FS1-H7996/R]
MLFKYPKSKTMGKDNSYLDKYFIIGLVMLVVIVITINIVYCIGVAF